MSELVTVCDLTNVPCVGSPSGVGGGQVAVPPHLRRKIFGLSSLTWDARSAVAHIFRTRTGRHSVTANTGSLVQDVVRHLVGFRLQSRARSQKSAGLSQLLAVNVEPPSGPAGESRVLPDVSAHLVVCDEMRNEVHSAFSVVDTAIGCLQDL